MLLLAAFIQYLTNICSGIGMFCATWKNHTFECRIETVARHIKLINFFFFSYLFQKNFFHLIKNWTRIRVSSSQINSKLIYTMVVDTWWHYIISMCPLKMFYIENLKLFFLLENANIFIICRLMMIMMMMIITDTYGASQ